MNRLSLRRRAAQLLSACAFALFHSPAVSASELAIINAHILSMGSAGEIANGSILVRDGRIVAIGTGVTIPDGATIIDATGGIATPGFILIGTSASTVEFPLSTQFNDSATDAYTAAFDMQYALNPNSPFLAEIRRNGSTLALVLPQVASDRKQKFGYFGGQAALITLAPGNDIVVRSGVAVTLQMGVDGAQIAGGGRSAQIQQLRSLFTQLGSGSKGDAKVDGLKPEDAKVLASVAAGTVPLIITAHRESDILQALALAHDFNLKIILDGAEEGWMVADKIAKQGVAALVDGDDGDISTEKWGVSYANAARLSKAGVAVATRLGDSNFVWRFSTSRYNAGFAVANGMDRMAALASLTTVPAQLFGVADHYGSLDVGKQADIVLWTSDPLEPASRPKHVIISGIDQRLISRETMLRDRYLPASVNDGQP